MKDAVILDLQERELRARLEVDLPRVVAGKDSLYFFNVENNPFDLPPMRLSTRGSAAFELACQIRDLRVRIGAPALCEASLLLDAIRDHGDRGNSNRLGSKKLAARLAADVGMLPSDGATRV